MRAVSALLLALAACPSTADGPPFVRPDAASPDAASLPALLTGKVYGNYFSMERGLVRTSLRCAADAGQGDAGCQAEAIALVFASASPCPPDQGTYRSVEIYLTRWTAGTYRVGTTDPISVKFVRKDSPSWRESRQATSGTLTLSECTLAPSPRCLGTLAAEGPEGDRALGTVRADLTCPE